MVLVVGDLQSGGVCCLNAVILVRLHQVRLGPVFCGCKVAALTAVQLRVNEVVNCQQPSGLVLSGTFCSWLSDNLEHYLLQLFDLIRWTFFGWGVYFLK